MVSVRNTDLNVFLRIPIFKVLARKITDNAVGVLFLSEAYKEKYLDICYRHKKESVLKKCDVIPNGLESFWLDNINANEKTIHKPLELLCVGKIDKNKNMKTVTQVVSKLNEYGTDTHLTVIGQVLDEQIKDLLDKSSNVTVIPFMTKEELIDYYRNSDIFVMPSFNETFGRVYVEAMTQGVPVIYTRGQGFDGTFAEGVVGYSVKADDVTEIVSSVKKIIDNYTEVSRNCIEKCKVFNWPEIAERLERLYKNAI